MKIGFFSPYLSTLGGGERYLLTIAEYFLNRGDEVNFYTDSTVSIEDVSKRFNINLTGIKFLPDIFFSHTSPVRRLYETSKYDWFVFLSDGSVPLSLAKHNIMHFQIPHKLNGRGPATKLKLAKMTAIICNSNFTKKVIDQSFGINSQVIYPPVNLFKLAKNKEKIILSLGRFFGSSDARVASDPKKHREMIDVFKSWHKKNSKLGWRLILAGGMTPDSQELVASLKKEIKNYPISIVTNPSFTEVANLYAKASIYWHATGYGEDIDKYPERTEHFGMTTVEAMSTGAVPVVFAKGGQPEIVTDGENGFLWLTTEELLDKTLQLATNTALRQKLGQAAAASSKRFDREHFFKSLDKIVNAQ